jgi:NAD(P)H-dependent flavin oxidoreductase YrpB (nitropropane dioxygenase family)
VTRDAVVQPEAGTIPSEHKAFIRSLGAEAGLPAGWDDVLDQPELAAVHVNTTAARTRELLEVCLEFSPRMLVSALGPLPAEVVTELHGRGIVIGGMCGTARHAVAHVNAGADVVIAQGSEAGGHTGDIGTIVLVPEVVDAIAPVPVLAAGGIGNGRQMTAAMALGAAGVWTGSIWLTTDESDLEAELIDKLLRAGSGSTVMTRAFTGKPCRSLHDDEFVRAWERPDAPTPLPMPFQELLIRPMTTRVHASHKPAFMGTPVVQVVGGMRRRRPVAEVVVEMLTEFQETLERLQRVGFASALAGPPS